MTNEYGLDVDYFRKYMKRVLRDIKNYKPDELERELERMQSALPNYNNKEEKIEQAIKSAGFELVAFEDRYILVKE